MPRWGSDVPQTPLHVSDCTAGKVSFPSSRYRLEIIAASRNVHKNTQMSKVKRIAIIGAGPAGAISIDAFAQEQAFDIIRVFERRERPGGCWLVH